MSIKTKSSGKYTTVGTPGSNVMTEATKDLLNGESLASAQEKGIIVAEKFQMVDGEGFSFVTLVTDKGNVTLSSKLDVDTLAAWAEEEELGDLVFAKGISSVENGFTGKPYFRLQKPNGSNTVKTDLTVGQ